MVLVLAAAGQLASCGGGGDGEAVVVPGPVGGACLAAATNDTAVHAPPSSGPYAYSPPGGWLPGTAGFPALGSTFVDPVFGTTIRRITSEHPSQSVSDIYAQNGWWNANGTLFVQNTGADRVAINVATGSVALFGVPDGTVQVLNSFDPVDPDTWYYFDDTELRQFSISSQADTLVYDFPAPIERLGGSVDWIDSSGRYFLVAYSGELHIWSRTDGIYAGAIQFNAGSGWAGISPDGNYVVTVTTVDPPPPPLQNAVRNLTSYAIDHQARTLSTTGVLFWNLCGDHGDLVSASDGKTYFVTFECFDQGAVYRVDVTTPQAATPVDPLDRQNQRNDNRMLVDLEWDDNNGHFSCVSSGPNRDWCFMSVESTDDTFQTDQGQWRPYKQEILAVQVVPPYSIKRLAHHRSRSMSVYSHQPRVSAGWDGGRIAFLSNFGHDANADPEGYGDIYVLDPSCAP